MKHALLAIFFAAAFLAPIIFASGESSQSLRKQSEEENAKLSSSLWHYAVPFPSDATQSPSVSDPFNFASIRMLSAEPSVSGEVSSLHPPRIYWAWGESHAHAVRSPTNPSGPCPAPYTEISEAGPAVLEQATATFSTSIAAKSVNAASSPIQSPLPQSGLDSEPAAQGSSNQSAPALLNVTLTAIISAPYTVYEHKSDYVCTTQCTASGCTKTCGCVQTLSAYGRDFKKQVSDSKSFELQTGTVPFFLLSPPLGYALAYGPRISVLALSSRKPEIIMLRLDNKTFAASRIHSYSLSHGTLGEAVVIRSAPPANTTLGDESLALPLNEKTAALDITNETRHIRILQLAPGNFSSYYALSAQCPAGAGTSSLSAVFFDEFGDSFTSDFALTLRAPSQIMPASNGSFQVLDNLGNPLPASGTPAPAPSNQDPNPAPAAFRFNGSDTLLPSSFYPPLQPNSINLSVLWPIAALLAFLFLRSRWAQ